jgi:hypothetical protein
MADEVAHARAALAAGREDEALVLLWNALEPARMAGDEKALGEIAALARTIPRREAADLVVAAGNPPDPEPEPATVKATERSAWRGRLGGAVGWLFFGLVVAALIASFFDSREGETQAPSPRGEPSTPTVVDNDPGVRTLGADALYLVPLGDYPSKELFDVGGQSIHETGAMDVLPALPLALHMIDRRRHQLIAEELFQLMGDHYLVQRGHAIVVVGVTTWELYERRRPEQEFAPVAHSDDGRYVVISAAHLGPGDELRKEQLRQLALREFRRVRRAASDAD